MLPTSPNRRQLLASGAALSFGFSLTGCVPLPEGEASEQGKLAALEKSSGGRLGVFVLDTASGKTLGNRADERFGMCSTFKLSLAALVLYTAQQGKLRLDEWIDYGAEDLENYAPVTRANLSRGRMTVAELAKAAQETSDNTAANLLLAKLGGPAVMTQFWRDIGDDVTRLDRNEPTMNLVPEGEIRDTTSPRAMAGTMRKILTGNLLSLENRHLLTGWTESTSTGKRRIKAGLPASWRVGNKTGTGIADAMANKTNDTAIFWPPSRPPVIVTAYYESDGYYDHIRREDEAVLAEVGRIAAAQAVEWHGGLD